MNIRGWCFIDEIAVTNVSFVCTPCTAGFVEIQVYNKVIYIIHDRDHKAVLATSRDRHYYTGCY